MQKKLIALAIAGLASSAAFAQTNVTIYGVADVYYANQNSNQSPNAGNLGGNDAKFSGLASGGLSGSRLGFRASEDLGGGLSAGMLYEFGTLNPDGGGAAGAASVSGLDKIRQSYVFISSSTMGSFQGGRIYTPGNVASSKFDPEASSVFGPLSRITTGLGLSIDGAGNNNSRVNNSLAWLSPNWKGFTAQVQYAFGENGEQTATTAAGNGGNDARMWALGVDYSNGPWAVGFAYNDWSDFGGQLKGPLPSRDLTEWFLGGSYDFGMVKLTGSYQDFDMHNMNTTTSVAGNGLKSTGDIWSLGAIVPVFKVGAVTLSYASLSRDTRNVVGGPKMSADADGWGISYRHNLSKRTTAYVGYTTLDNNNKRNAVSTLGVAPNTGLAAPSAGQSADGYGMGVRHMF